MGFWDQRHELDSEVTDASAREVWADGRDRYLTFLIDLTDDVVVDTLADVVEGLDSFNCVRTAPPEYFHITVKQVGFLVDNPQTPDEVSVTDRDTIVEHAADVFAECEPFTVRLPRVDLFPSAVFCAVSDDGQLRALHEDLMQSPAIPTLEDDGDSYEPHVTLAQFQGTTDFDGFVDWLGRNREIVAGRVRIDSVTLVEVNPYRFFPESRIIEQFALGTEA